jgi:hypothetical protein
MLHDTCSGLVSTIQYMLKKKFFSFLKQMKQREEKFMEFTVL